MTQPYQPDDLASTLRNRHARFLGPHQKMVIAGMHYGYSLAAMAGAFRCSKVTVARCRKEAHPYGLRSDRDRQRD